MPRKGSCKLGAETEQTFAADRIARGAVFSPFRYKIYLKYREEVNE